MNTEIVIIGATHHNTLSMLRAIGQVYGQICLVVTDGPKSYLTKSRYIKECIYICGEDEILQYINKKAEQSVTIIISCSDACAKLLDENRAQLHKNVNTFHCNKDFKLATLMNKQRQVDTAKEYGIKVPKSIVFKNTYSIPTQGIIFPCILKPLKSYQGGKHIVICQNHLELTTAIKEFPEGIEIQIQQLIENKYEIVIPGYAVNQSVEMPAFILKYRENSGATTYSMVKHHNELTTQLVNKLALWLKDVGYNGLFGAEFIFNGNDFYFIELNFRNDATCYSVAKAGVNIAANYIEMIKNHSTLMTHNTISEINSIVEFNDFSFVLRGKISLYTWYKQLKSSQCRFYFDKEDIAPFWRAFGFWLHSWTIGKFKK